MEIIQKKNNDKKDVMINNKKEIDYLWKIYNNCELNEEDYDFSYNKKENYTISICKIIIK